MPRPGGGEDTGQAPTPGIDPNAPHDHTAPKRGFDRLADQFERLRRQSSGENARERADELRRRAEEMLENATPEERRRMLEEFEQFRRERAAQGMDAPPRERAAGDEEIDLTDPERDAGPERVVGDWYSDRPRLPDDETSRRALLDTVRESRQAAERGLETQRIPERYQDFIRRVFDRYAEEIERGPIGPERGPVDNTGGAGGSGGGGGG